MTDIKLPSGRTLVGYDLCSSRAIADGSHAQMAYFVEDAKKDIAYLAALSSRSAEAGKPVAWLVRDALYRDQAFTDQQNAISRAEDRGMKSEIIPLFAAPVADIEPVSVPGAAEAHNAAFDPANEALGGAFRDGFREGWLFAKSPDFEEREELEADYSQEVDIAPSECWDAYRSHYFAMLPLAAIPEYRPEIAAPAVTSAEKAGVVDEAAIIAKCAAIADMMVIKADGVEGRAMSRNIAASIRALSTTKPAQGDGELARAASELLAVFDEQSQVAQRIVVGGRSDRELRKAGNDAIAKIRSALTAQGDDAQEGTVADRIIGQIEELFPDWRSYRDLIDCIECTLHRLKSEARR